MGAPDRASAVAGSGRFKDTVAIITGASTGLGPVMAKMMAAEGARLILAARRLELVQATAAEIGDAAVAAMVDAALNRWGKVDILMNNAAAPGTDKYIW